MPNTPNSRAISIDDLDIVRDLALQIWPKSYRSTIAPDQIDSLVSHLFDIETLEEDITVRGHRFWVMQVGRCDVGFVSAHMMENRIWITKLCILPDFRGFGLAKALIETVQSHFPKADDLVICVHKTHVPAVAFCLRAGFDIAREIPSNIEHGFTDYVMRKDLRQSQRNEVRAA
jgi:ribosomal protein S18 acetylase RimI-like enzyme